MCRIIPHFSASTTYRLEELPKHLAKPSSIIVDSNGTKLTFTDSGIPPDNTSAYTTVFAVHGVEFTAGIFQNVQAMAPAAGLRVVAINRRNYAGSTPFSQEDLTVIHNGTDTQKEEFLKARGLEILNFMDIFVQQNDVPTILDDGKGGIALLGWSLGNSFTLAAISHFDSLPTDAQSRLASRMRSLIMQEPPSVSIGASSPPQIWSPQIDTSIPEFTRIPMFTQWITSYFQHGDLSTRNTDVLSYVLPATFHAPSIFNMTASQIASIVGEWQNNAIDSPFQVNFKPQSATSYRRACYSPATRAMLPKMKVWEIVGDATCSFPLSGLFTIQNDNDAEGGGFINFNIIHNSNHFMHWDEPVTAIDAYLKALTQGV